MDIALDVAENCLFRKIRILSREIESSYTNSMKQIGVTPAQFALMTAIRLLREANMNRLSEVTKTDRTTINRNLKPLVKEGYVALHESQDRREKVICMLSEGDRIYESVYDEWQETQQRYRERLGDELWKKLHEVLSEVNVKMNEKSTKTFRIKK